MVAIEDLREVGPGIFYVDPALAVVSAGPEVVEHLKAVAASIPPRRARLCAHPDPEAEQQDMLIVSHRDTYVAPHRHRVKSETMLVLDGLAEAYLFAPDGALTSVIPMGSLASGRTFFYRMPAGRFHGLRVESEFLTFVESTKGPFRKSTSENAPWAPGPDDSVAGMRFVADHARKAAGHEFRGERGLAAKME